MAKTRRTTEASNGSIPLSSLVSPQSAAPVTVESILAGLMPALSTMMDTKISTALGAVPAGLEVDDDTDASMQPAPVASVAAPARRRSTSAPGAPAPAPEKLMGAVIQRKRGVVGRNVAWTETPLYDQSKRSVTIPANREGEQPRKATCYLDDTTRAYVLGALSNEAPALQLRIFANGEDTGRAIMLTLGESSSGSVMYQARNVELHAETDDGCAVTFKSAGIFLVAQQFNRPRHDGDNA